MRTYTATIENNSAIIMSTENNEVIYAVRYDNLTPEELEAIDYMTSEDLRHYVNRNEGVIVNLEEVEEEEDDDNANLPTIYTVNDTETGNCTIYCGTSLDTAKEAILEDEDPEAWDLYIDEERIWCGQVNTIGELKEINSNED